MHHDTHNWYVRRGAEESGPFPAGLVSRYILLGRIRGDDEVSWDRAEWLTVSEVPELFPAVLREALADPENAQARARLAAARRWADERVRAQKPSARPGERRSEEAPEMLGIRRARASRRNGTREEGLRPIHYGGFGLVLALLVAVPFVLPSENGGEGVSDCTAPAGPGVNWNGCLLSASDLANVDLAGAQLQGTNLSGATLRAANLGQGQLAYANLVGTNLRGADLRGAELMGANLRRADLTRADLRGANLAYAILQGARLEGARFEGARFDYAEWRDGLICMPGLLGRCRPARKRGN